MLVEVSRGDAGTFHARGWPELPEPQLWWFEVDRPALVLGSSQPLDHVDLAACAGLGVDVVRRRSGGGAVLLEPGDAIWLDVLIPPSDPRWTNDVTTSALWLGEAWRHALSALGVGATTIHRGSMLRTEWSGQVCFAGRGAGEVFAGSAKVVGISQRRGRTGARFQCVLYRHWRPEHHVQLLAAPAPSAADLAGLAFEVAATPAEVREAFAAALSA